MVVTRTRHGGSKRAMHGTERIQPSPTATGKLRHQCRGYLVLLLVTVRSRPVYRMQHMHV